MLATRKLALVAVALLVSGCSALPTDSDASAAPTLHQTSVAAPDSGSAGTTSSSGAADSRGGNLFGSGT
jgi:hypothetical protein